MMLTALSLVFVDAYAILTLAQPATATNLANQLTSGSVVRLEELFSMVDSSTNASGSKLSLGFALRAFCYRSDAVVWVMSDSAEFRVSVIHPKADRQRKSSPFRVRWPKDRVLELLAGIEACEKVYVYLGDTLITVHYDDAKWTIRSTDQESLPHPREKPH